MITKFDSLFAGHADLDNVGYGGTPINQRRYSNAHLATALSKAQSMARLMDALGYHCFWTAEHHFQREGTECIPNNILLAVHLAHLTKTLKSAAVSTSPRCGIRCGWRRTMPLPTS